MIIKITGHVVRLFPVTLAHIDLSLDQSTSAESCVLQVKHYWSVCPMRVCVASG